MPAEDQSRIDQISDILRAARQYNDVTDFSLKEEALLGNYNTTIRLEKEICEMPSRYAYRYLYPILSVIIKNTKGELNAHYGENAPCVDLEIVGMDKLMVSDRGELNIQANVKNTGNCQVADNLTLASSQLRAFEKAHPISNDYINLLVIDPQFAADSIKVGSLRWYLEKLAANAQSHDGMVAPYDIFTEDEINTMWLHDNASWFVSMGNSALTDNLAPFSQRRLLRNFIESADTAIASLSKGANLRFGHEVCVLPLVVLMELDHYGEEINDLELVADRWKNYEIFPMASNVQMIFYRPLDGKSDVLVKVLLNEREVSLPIADKSKAPYYKWNDVKEYYLHKLARVAD